MRKKICLILVVLVFSISSTSVFAGELEGQAGIQPRYVIINTIVASLDIDSSGQATCSGRLVSASSGSDCYITMDLQQKSGTQWNTIKTWTASKLNGADVTIEKDYYVVHGTYRVKVTGTIEKDDIEETAVKHSKEVVY